MVKYSLQEEIDYAKRIIARDKKDLDISETLRLGKEKKRDNIEYVDEHIETEKPRKKSYYGVKEVSPLLFQEKETWSFQQNNPELQVSSTFKQSFKPISLHHN